MSSDAKFKWDKRDTMLLTQYERFPEQWNITLKEYGDKEKKRSAVKEIAETFNVYGSEIRRKWHNLRCQMNSEIRNIKIRRVACIMCVCMHVFIH